MAFTTLFLVGCSNAIPEVDQLNSVTKLTPDEVTISTLGSRAIISGSCPMLDDLGKEFELYLDNGSPPGWTSFPESSCVGERFTIGVDGLGDKMGFVKNVHSEKSLKIRRTSLVGKAPESEVRVRYRPYVPGQPKENGFAEGHEKKLTGTGYIMKGTLSSSQKEAVLTGGGGQYKMILSREHAPDKL